MENRTILQAREVVFDPKPPVSDAAKNFIRRCMTFKKDLRPDVFQIAKDPYLKPTQMRPRYVSRYQFITISSPILGFSFVCSIPYCTSYLDSTICFISVLHFSLFHCSLVCLLLKCSLFIERDSYKIMVFGAQKHVGRRRWSGILAFEFQCQ